MAEAQAPGYAEQPVRAMAAWDGMRPGAWLQSKGASKGAAALAGDRAVCALPCPVIGSILDGARIGAAKQRAIREQHYSHTAKVFLQSRTRFWLKDRWSGHVTTDLAIERLTPDPGT